MMQLIDALHRAERRGDPREPDVAERVELYRASRRATSTPPGAASRACSSACRSSWTEAPRAGRRPLERLADWLAAGPPRLAGLRGRKGADRARARRRSGRSGIPTRASASSPPLLEHRHRVTPVRRTRSSAASSRPPTCAARRFTTAASFARRGRRGTLAEARGVDGAGFTELLDPRLRAPRRRRRSTRTTTSSPRRRTSSSPARPVWKEHEYTDRGKWMDGWETPPQARRPGHDCAHRPARPARRRARRGRRHRVLPRQLPGVLLDRGLRGARRTRDVEALLERRDWIEILPKSDAEGRQREPVRDRVAARASPTCASHLSRRRRGAAARARRGRARTGAAQGGSATRSISPRSRTAATCSRAATCSSAPKHNLIMPGRAREHGRRLGDAAPPRARARLGDRAARAPRHRCARIEVDTNHFKGNYPDTCSIEGARAATSPTTNAWRRSCRARSSRRTRGTSSTTSSRDAGRSRTCGSTSIPTAA